MSGWMGASIRDGVSLTFICEAVEEEEGGKSGLNKLQALC